MHDSSILEASDALAIALLDADSRTLAAPLRRFTLSNVACSLALEHWHATRTLIRSQQLPSAVVLHRAQFEALTRAIWLLYAASDAQLDKLAETLTPVSEQAAKNMPQLQEMIAALAPVAPPPAVAALARFRDTSWRALNSYAHAGIHAIQRHQGGYPTALLEDVLRNANGLGLLSCMQIAVLSGDPTGQRRLLAIAQRFPACMPPPL